MIRVIVQFFGPATDMTGCPERSYELPDASTMGELVARLHADHPKLQSAGNSLRYAVNCNYATAEANLADGDQVAVIPPVSGG